jgi:hypothetical protein
VSVAAWSRVAKTASTTSPERMITVASQRTWMLLLGETQIRNSDQWQGKKYDRMPAI